MSRDRGVDAAAIAVGPGIIRAGRVEAETENDVSVREGE
jgi:hypothetical protein